MKLKTYPKQSKPVEGDYKIKKCFAWWPKRVENRLIWLESYKEIYLFRIRERYHYIYKLGLIGPIKGGGWDLITLQLISK